MNAGSAVCVIADRACVAARDTAALRLTLRPAHGAPMAFRWRCARRCRLAQSPIIAPRLRSMRALRNADERAPTDVCASREHGAAISLAIARWRAENGD
ncbi:hypothetical protein KM539_05955 [Xanthomonas translucens pv. poae]|uniref:hypothetical protein n=1 Tax=Xanthomonas graminis TaxID=3390026 RepID=UPI001112EC94|nr:hypothetical protein [Xanthomonas translucens]UKE63018.1 hypothetical protein KM539_05955 [Xanthomonas translucens pv. poae]